MSITLIPSTLARISRGPVGWTLKETLNFHQRWHQGIRGIIQKPYGNVHVKNPEKSHSNSVASNILNQFFFKRLRLHVNRNQQKHCCCYCQERCKNPHVTLPILRSPARTGQLRSVPQNPTKNCPFWNMRLCEYHPFSDTPNCHSVGLNFVEICTYIRRPRQTQGGARQGIILLTLVSDYYRSRRSSSNSRRSKAGLRVACYCEWFRSQVAVAEQPAVGRCFCCLCGPQVGVGGSGRQRQSFNFLGVPLLRFGDEIRWCFAVSDVSKRVSGCLFLALEAVWLQQHHSSTTAAAATSSCTSSRQQQGAAGSSRQAAAAFSGMVFRYGEGYVLEACSSSCFVKTGSLLEVVSAVFRKRKIAG